MFQVAINIQVQMPFCQCGDKAELHSGLATQPGGSTHYLITCVVCDYKERRDVGGWPVTIVKDYSRTK
jgi:hypothetical protein